MCIPTRSALIGLVLASAASGALVPSALAKDFYTRKRIDGRWIYGEFPKKGSQAERDQAVQQALQPTQAPTPVPAAPAASSGASYGLGLHFPPPVQTPAPNPAQAADQVAATEILAATGSIRRGRRYASRSERRVAPQTRVQREKARDAEARPELRPATDIESRPPVARDAPSPAEQKEHFASLPAPAEKPAGPVVDPTQRLAQALAAKAAALASGVIASAADPIPQPKAEPVSVNYDYKKGIKTVTYANGAREEEPFDPSTMKALATTTRTTGAP